MPSHYFTTTTPKLANAGKGRPKGSPNKTGAVIRWGLVEAYRRLGGVDGLVRWGKRKPDLFYPLLGRLIPAEIADQHGVSGGKIQVVILPAESSQTMPSEPKQIESMPNDQGDEAGVPCRQAGVAVREPEA